jgi:hypothetical protein
MIMKLKTLTKKTNDYQSCENHAFDKQPTK